jgi:hypothetical protein
LCPFSFLITMNTIYLRRKNKIIIQKGSGDLPENYLAALLKNIENLGYTLSQEVLDVVRTFSLEELEAFYLQLVEDLKKMVGAHHKFKPMYPNFPRQVMEMSEAHLYFNAIIHYLTGLRPVTKVKERLPLFDDIKPKIIGLGTVEEFEAIFTNLCASKTSISEQDKEDLAWFVQHYGDGIAPLLPTEFPSKENLSIVGALLLKHTTIAPPFLAANFKTATDVLRLAVAMSNGDVSLAKPTKFGKFSRPQRRVILELTENCGALTEDMLRWEGRWLRLGERLHVGEYKARYPKTFAAIDVLRNDKPFQSFYGEVECKIEARDATGALELLRTRPGELARKLDHLLRLNLEQAPITLEVFEGVAPQIATPVLLQVASHFRHRNENQPLRIFFPKGQIAKVQAIENKLPEIPQAISKRAVAICENTLRERFAALEPLGKCYIDPKLRDFLVPFSQRSAAKALRTLVRGSKLDLPQGDTLRFFLWWKNGIERTDIDLSAAFYDENFVYVDVVSYYNLKSFGGHHSGDIVDAPNGAAEFIDVSRAKLNKKKVRYVVMCINSYTEQPFCDLPECFAGWMPRQKPDSGEIFEARTVTDRVDIASDTRICLPALFDLVENKVIWLDIALKKDPSWNNVENNKSGVSLMGRALSNLQKPTLYELFALHIAARGELVDSPDAAQTVFSLEKGITPFDLAEIGANWL